MQSKAIPDSSRNKLVLWSSIILFLMACALPALVLHNRQLLGGSRYVWGSYQNIRGIVLLFKDWRWDGYVLTSRRLQTHCCGYRGFYTFLKNTKGLESARRSLWLSRPRPCSLRCSRIFMTKVVRQKGFLWHRTLDSSAGLQAWQSFGWKATGG